MRIFPVALIVVGAFGVAKHFNLVPVGTLHLVGPLLLIALGVALFLRHPRRCRGDWRDRKGGGGNGPPQPLAPG